MCVLALAWQHHPRWQLVLAGNRDERHDRAALPLGRWEAAAHVLGGIDIVSGGSWLGVSEEGRLAVVTNLRGHGAPDPARPSRGLLVRDVLMGQGPLADPKAGDMAAFNPLNLIVVGASETVFLSNHPKPHRLSLDAGLYGMSNGGFDDGWPKTDRLKGFLGDWLDEDSGEAARLLDALGDEHRPGDDDLPRTGLTIEQERTGGSIFMRHPLYGTRCSSVIAIATDGLGEILERRFDAEGRTTGETRLTFAWT